MSKRTPNLLLEDILDSILALIGLEFGDLEIKNILQSL